MLMRAIGICIMQFEWHQFSVVEQKIVRILATD